MAGNLLPDAAIAQHVDNATQRPLTPPTTTNGVATDPLPAAPSDLVAPLPPSSPPSPLPGAGTTFQSGVSDYLLGPGDQVEMSVIGFPEFADNRTVLPDGTLLLPLIGTVVADGKTISDLEIEITRRLSYYLVDPVVNLNLAVLRPIVVVVGGEVNRPGPVQLNSLSTFNTRVTNDAQLTSEVTSPTLSTALVGAGGVRRSADLREIEVQRRLVDGDTVRFNVNLWESIFRGGDGANILLRDGDVVFVPEAPLEADIDPQLVARSSLAPDVVRVRVIGEVRSPGEVQVPPDGSVSAAIAVAGGHNIETADLANVTLLRLQANGQVEEQSLNLNNLVDGTPIQDGDVVVVPKKNYLNTLDNISRALSPIAAPFNFILLLDRLFQ